MTRNKAKWIAVSMMVILSLPIPTIGAIEGHALAKTIYVAITLLFTYGVTNHMKRDLGV